MLDNGLDFERPLAELERQIAELKKSSHEKQVDLSAQIEDLERRLQSEKEHLYSHLTPWQRICIARHPKRPYSLDYINLIANAFVEMHGDRLFADDHAIVGGIARLDRHRVMIIGHQKGRDSVERVRRNWGMPHPEGYRKAMRLMKVAEKFHLPVLCLIDTPGAYPGIGAEERGQAQAIAFNLREMMTLHTPILAVVTGEGCSGGAIGIGVGDTIAIFQHAYYSVISPEGCASILWRDAAKAPEAANALRLTAEDLLSQNLVDEIIPEPLGGAHRNPGAMGTTLKQYLLSSLDRLTHVSLPTLLQRRYDRFRRIGVFTEKIIKLTEGLAASTAQGAESDAAASNGSPAPGP